MSSSLLNSVSINKANVQDANISDLTATKLESTTANISDLTATKLESTTANISDLTATKLESTTANISDLTVDNLTVNNITDPTPDYDVIVVGGGIAAITAILKLSKEIPNKKIALFTDADKLTDLEFYQTLMFNPNNLPEDALPKKDRDILIEQFNNNATGTLNAITGGYSNLNIQNFEYKMSDVYNLKNDNITNNIIDTAGTFKGGGLAYVKKIGGQINMNSGLAIVDPAYYKVNDGDIEDGAPIDLTSELSYVTSIYNTTQIYPNFEPDFSVLQLVDRESAKNYAKKVLESINTSILGSTSNARGDALVEPQYYYSAGRINFQRMLDTEETNNPNLYIFYNSFVENLQIINNNNKLECKGIYSNSKLITANHVILSGGFSGTVPLLLTANSTIETPLRLENLGTGWSETQACILPIFTPNFKNEYYLNDNKTSSFMYNNVRAYSNPNKGASEIYDTYTFDLENNNDLLKFASLLNSKKFADNNDLISDTFSMQIVQLVAFLHSQEMVYDTSWPDLTSNSSLIGTLQGAGVDTSFLQYVQQNKPSGKINFTVTITYTGSKYNKYLSNESNIIKMNTQGTMNKCDPKSSYNNPTTPGTPGKDQNLITYNTVKNMLSHQFKMKYFDFVSDTPEDIKNEVLNDMRKILDGIFYGNTSYRHKYYNNVSLGKYDYSTSQYVQWSSADIDNIPAQFNNGALYFPIYFPHVGMSNDAFLDQLQKNSIVTWHWTQATSKYIDINTFKFNTIDGLYSGDLNAFPNVVPTSTSFLSACCATRAANSVISSLTN